MEFLTKKHMSRRTVLRGLGVTMALPLLDAMTPASVFAQAAAAGRFACRRSRWCTALPARRQFGLGKHFWSPAAVGRAFDLSPGALSSLEPFRDYVTIVSNTDVRNAEAYTLPEIGGDHFRSSAVFLTQAHPKQTEGSDVLRRHFAGSDVRAALRPGHADPVDAAVHRERRSGRRLRLRLLLRVHGLASAGRRPTEPLPMIRDPRVAFDKLFGAGATPEERAAQRRSRQQHPRLGHRRRGAAEARTSAPTIARVWTQYLEEVREIERRIQRIEARNTQRRSARTARARRSACRIRSKSTSS